EAKQQAVARYQHGTVITHTTFTLPWVTPLVEGVQGLMGRDWWPYGLEANRKALDAFLGYHHEQGLSKRRYQPEELFLPELLSD
ncbi:MAG TPA: 4,5-dihydroxyphthalate decarboxylase, partial [Chloroflexota bacterium]|nr:4,5-dihydroxyphthalate decarboxylase [Chloroflexota bacterium]